MENGEQTLKILIHKIYTLHNVKSNADVDEVIEYVKYLENKIRQDTLRQVLPEDDNGESEEDDYGIWGGRSMIERLKNKAKELWGIELNNLNK